MNSAWIARLLVLATMAAQYHFHLEVSNVYVSQHGSDTPSCGTDIHPCKTIAMGVWLAKQHALVYVDGNGSETTPFSCKSSASEIPGILSNKSLSIVGVHSMVHVNCQEGSDIRFIKSMPQNETIVSVSNFKFINTTIQGQDISLDINDCIFNGSSQAINLVQSTIGSITLLFTSSLCVNVGSCMAVRVMGLLKARNRISIGVTNSSVVASGLNSYSSIPGAVGIHVTSGSNSNYTSYTQELMACDIALRNVSFQNNIFNGMGIVNVALLYVVSVYAENVFVYNNTLVTSHDAAILNFGGVYNHTMTLKNVTFLQNKGDSYLPILVSAVDDISLGILSCRFENNYGIMTLLSRNNVYLNIENTIFVGNFGCNDRTSLFHNQLFIFVLGERATSVALKDSIFHNNWCEKCIFGMIALQSNLQTNVVITNCHFVSNVADTPSFFMLYIASEKKVFFKMVNSTIIGNAGTESSGAVYIITKDIADVLLSNVTFEGCVNGGYIYGGALYLSLTRGNININFCKFIGNRSPAMSGGAVAFQLQGGDSLIDPGCIGEPSLIGTFVDDGYRPYRQWTYNASVVITNTIFANNSAVNGGALSLSGGNYTIRGCTFIDNFAHAQGGHIYSITDSTRLEILDSTFLQKLSQMIVSHERVYGTSIGLFIYSLSVGSLTIFNTTLKSAWSRDVHLKTLIYISKGSLIDFGDNNQTIVECPRGGSLNILNYTTIVDTEYQSKPCKIALTLLQFNCKACPIDTYSLQHGHSLGMTKVSGFECLPCPFGAVCHNKISAKPNYWGYEVEENPSELNFTQCPLRYCNITDSNDFVDYNSCLGNRSGTLCGHCKENYSETLLTPSCRRDDECNDYWLWGVGVVMVMLMALYLIHKPRLSHILKKQILWFKYFPDNVEEQGPVSEDNRVGSGYLKIVFYFYQVANIILVTTSYDDVIKSYLLQPIIGLFNFQIRLSTSGLLCPFRGLTAVTKQLLFASQVFGVVVMIGVCCCCHRLLRLCRSRPPPNFGPYIGAVLETLLLGYAVFAHTFLQLLRCTPLARDWRLFIDGTVSCYQWWQYVLMVFVGTAVVPFILTLALGSHWLHKGSISVKEFVLGCVLPLPYLVYKLISLLCGTSEANQEPREWRVSVTSVLYGPFRVPKDDSFGAVYWESILIFRRLILIVIYVFVRDPLSKELLLTFASVVILCHHIIVRPFHDTTANIIEMMSLFFLFSLASINTFKASFISIGAELKGPLISFENIMDWIQIFILMAIPGLCLLVVLAAIVSQIIRLVIKLLSYITLKCIRSRDVLVIDDVDRNLLEHCSNID